MMVSHFLAQYPTPQTMQNLIIIQYPFVSKLQIVCKLRVTLLNLGILTYLFFHTKIISFENILAQKKHILLNSTHKEYLH